jgi:hypothetical protein
VAEEYREVDDERVLVLVHLTGRGKTSGLEIGQVRVKGAELFHVCGGKVTTLVLYMDRDRALTDLGLAREADWYLRRPLRGAGCSRALWRAG